MTDGGPLPPPDVRTRHVIGGEQAPQRTVPTWRQDVKRNRRWWIIIAVLAPVAIVGAITGGANNDSETASSAGSDDILAMNACTTFASIQRDADLMTDVEIRGRIQEVWDDAQYAGSVGVRSAARELLAAATDLNTAGVTAAGNRLVLACNALLD